MILETSWIEILPRSADFHKHRSSFVVDYYEYNLCHVGTCPPCWNMSSMLEHVRHVGTCPPCWNMPAMLEHVRHVGTCPPCWNMSAMLEHVRHVGTCPPCWNMSAMLEHVRHVGTCPPCWNVSARVEATIQTSGAIWRGGGITCWWTMLSSKGYILTDSWLLLDSLLL